MARKSHDDGGGGNEWMNTYSDLVTLLMTFFVLLFSMSSVNAEKWEKFIEAMNNDPDAATTQIVENKNDKEGDAPLENKGEGDTMTPGDPSEIKDFTDLFEVLQKYVEEQGLQNAIEVSKSGDNVVYIRFKNNIFFQPDKSDLRAEGREILGFLGECLQAVQEQIHIISINGHTADVGNDNYAVSDWMLSSARAGQVADFLDMAMDIEPTKLRPMGYGKNYPVADNSTQEGREQNRRVDMTIVKDDGSVDQQLADLFDPAQFPKSGGGLDLMEPSTTPGTSELPTQTEDQPPAEPAPEESQPPAEPAPAESQPPAEPAPAESQPPAEPAPAENASPASSGPAPSEGAQ
ncbi:MAG: OmpA family protein [Angelakisella sp.]|jgi:chemotaxis protein MotB|nr:OmpA family protein [Angelakisella sp.]MCI9528104.1 OmpA family protein [Angelakisella sp.]